MASPTNFYIPPKMKRIPQPEPLAVDSSCFRGGEEIIGDSWPIRQALEKTEMVAPTNSTTLICGETGTGKERFVSIIHNLSPRRHHAFVKINCSAIPAGFLESELFGHER